MNNGTFSPAAGVVAANFTHNVSAAIEKIWLTYTAPLNGWLAFTIIIWIGGSLFNLAILLTVLFNRQRSSSKVLIAHQLLLDLLQCALSMPADIFSTLYLRPFSSPGCAVMRVPFVWIECTAHWTALATTVNRFVAILFPQFYKRVSGPAGIFWFSAVPWLIGFLLSLPYQTGYGGYFMSNPPWYRCVLISSDKFSINNILYFGFVTPMALLALLYLALSLRMTVFAPNRGNRVSYSVPVDGMKQRLQKRYAVAKMLFLSSMLYVVFYLPNPVISWAAPQLLNGTPMPRMWLRTVYCLGFFINPVVFYCMNAGYRRDLQNMLGKLTSHFTSC
ncbi:hypothetical protein BV898_15210 [Hypsibius exemplaris]|uniref:G-protein coupled receptors family 1 profile domain-containing protein n=1 Tax=Hypsibius exemplaris TaxID=2072580 RepID=A0A9X6NDH4_HYPEX|nr:hypothetical protein BV898_15210 [Hypsibius exemplaris]